MSIRARSSASPERGATATVVASLLAAGVIFGFAALSVDMGALMFERRELQNGADAGALSLAKSCAEDDCEDSPQLHALVSANAHDDSPGSDDPSGHDIASLCVMNYEGDTGLPECSPPGSLASIVECPALPPNLDDDVSYVEVRTTSRSSEGGFVRNLFSGIASGEDSRTTVASCARAAWGKVGSTGTTFPLAIRDCNWEMATDGGTKFAPSLGPLYDPAPLKEPVQNPAPSIPEEFAENYVTHIVVHSSGNPTADCDPDNTGESMYTSGGFGWLDDEGGCSAAFDASGVVGGSTGASPQNDCRNHMAKWVGHEVLIPVFTEVAGNGANATYTLAGISSFYFAGWHDIPSVSPKSNFGVYKRPPKLAGSSINDMCKTFHKNHPGDESKMQDASCIWGWFTSPIVAVGSIDNSAPDKGVTVIRMGG